MKIAALRCAALRCAAAARDILSCVFIYAAT